MPRTGPLLVALIAVSIQLQACAESTLIRAYPPDAQVAVNGESLGPSPIQYTVSRDRWPRDGYFHYHVERAGYRPRDGSFSSKPAGGRITGGIFTLGILFLFKSPTALPESVEIVLEPVTLPAAAVSGSSPASNPGSPPEQIRRLETLRDQGTITEEEFKRQRNRILRNL